MVNGRVSIALQDPHEAIGDGIADEGQQENGDAAKASDQRKEM
jgi:hypothetical protein